MLPAHAPREIELKFAVADDQADALATALAPWPVRRKTRQVTTYFDTAGAALASRGLSLRVRHTGDGFVQTLKADRAAGVAANRAEWEWPVEANSPDLSLLAANPHWQFPPDLDLRPVVVTTIDRTVRLIECEDGTRIEAAYDEGMISAGNACRPVRELELELLQGNLSSLLLWALELHAAVPLIIENETKAQRGYRLMNIPATPNGSTRKPHDIPLGPGMPVAEVFRRVMTAALGHLLANQPGTLASEAQSMGQMRLAIRRLRAALTLFKPHLEPGATFRFQSELRRIGHLFRNARDGASSCPGSLPDTTPRGALPHPAATASPEAAQQDLVRELRAPPFTQLVLGLAAWIEQDAPIRCMAVSSTRTGACGSKSSDSPAIANPRATE